MATWAEVSSLQNEILLVQRGFAESSIAPSEWSIMQGIAAAKNFAIPAQGGILQRLTDAFKSISRAGVSDFPDDATVHQAKLEKDWGGRMLATVRDLLPQVARERSVIAVEDLSGKLPPTLPDPAVVGFEAFKTELAARANNLAGIVGAPFELVGFISKYIGWIVLVLVVFAMLLLWFKGAAILGAVA